MDKKKYGVLILFAPGYTKSSSAVMIQAYALQHFYRAVRLDVDQRLYTIESCIQNSSLQPYLKTIASSTRSWPVRFGRLPVSAVDALVLGWQIFKSIFCPRNLRCLIYKPRIPIAG